MRRSTARLLQLVDRGLATSRIQVDDGDPRPLGHEAACDGLADVATASGDDRYLVLEPHGVLLSSSMDVALCLLPRVSRPPRPGRSAARTRPASAAARRRTSRRRWRRSPRRPAPTG